ncbi:MAG: hypothetical protein U9O94_01280 [Nanoarchaeota archaeon]|nr:hypothetical protein [Nanoarchaeota archaeon]
MNAKQKLREWIRMERNFGQKYIKTSEIYAWGSENFSNRAVRNAQDMASKGKLLERIPKAEAVLLGFTGKEGVWKIKEN